MGRMLSSVVSESTIVACFGYNGIDVGVQDKLAMKWRLSSLQVVTRWIGSTGVEGEGLEVDSPDN